jgi:hypothetical protein
MRSGRVESAAGAPTTGVSEDAPLPPPPAMPFPRPQPGATAVPAGELPPPLPRPPLCSLPPPRPLPPSGMLTPGAPHRRASDAAAIAAAAAHTYVPPRDRIDDSFLAAVEEELKEMRSNRGGGFVQAVFPAVKQTESARPTAPVLEMADPLHAQLHDSKKQLRGMWIGIGLLLIAVLTGVVWTTVRMDRSERMITSLIEQLDAERTLSASYKQEITRLFQALTDSKAAQSKLASGQQKNEQPKTANGRLTSGK